MNARTTEKQLIGTTSWLVPGTYYENARLVAQSLNFVELLVYQWDRETKALFDSEKEKLISLHERYGLIYTVHLPTNNFDEVLKAYDYFEKLSCKLSVVNYVLHPYTDPRFDEFINFAPKVSVENLAERYIVHHRTVFDVGHHSLGVNVDESFLENVVEIHLMGISDRRDHVRLNTSTLEATFKTLGHRLFTTELICFEIFDLRDLIESIRLWEWWKNNVE
uniref:Sugar phosphate isomerase/epimerase n=1 Tax=Fervidobacterium thailandense TaxID=1008305 RepID=A0A7C5RJA2_9BACT